MRAVAHGVRLPDGIMAAYPATLLTAYASPSRLLSLMDPLLPLSVLSRCLSAYAGQRQKYIFIHIITGWVTQELFRAKLSIGCAFTLKNIIIIVFK